MLTIGYLLWEPIYYLSLLPPLTNRNSVILLKLSCTSCRQISIITSQNRTGDEWAGVGRQKMLWHKKQKSSPSHRLEEKAVTGHSLCFMVLLTLKEQVEWNVYNSGPNICAATVAWIMNTFAPGSRS